MKQEKDLTALWLQIAKDYEDIRREQEKQWASLGQDERIYLTEQLLLLSQEAERLEEAKDAGNVLAPAGDTE